MTKIIWLLSFATQQYYTMHYIHQHRQQINFHLYSIWVWISFSFMSSGIKINRYIVQTFMNFNRELQVKYTFKKDSQPFYWKVYFLWSHPVHLMLAPSTWLLMAYNITTDLNVKTFTFRVCTFYNIMMIQFGIIMHAYSKKRQRFNFYLLTSLLLFANVQQIYFHRLHLFLWRHKIYVTIPQKLHFLDQDISITTTE